MSRVRDLLVGGALAAALAVGGSAFAQGSDPHAGQSREGPRQCFFLTDWSGWRAAGPRALYIRVHRRDVWRIDLIGDCPSLQTTTQGLLFTPTFGQGTICTAEDFDLKVRTQGGPPEPCPAIKLTRLTAEQIAAIPPSQLP